MNTNTTYKTVEWAYPTSPDAKQFGYYGSGCWVLGTFQLIEGKDIPKSFFASDKREEALAKARELPHPWAHSFAAQYPDDAK